jgi:hypothetical protein
MFKVKVVRLDHRYLGKEVCVQVIVTWEFRNLCLLNLGGKALKIPFNTSFCSFRDDES